MAENLVINGVTFPAVRTITADNASGKTIKYHDLSGDTITSETLLYGITAHSAEGEPITGSMQCMIYRGEIVSAITGSGNYAVLTKDTILAGVGRLYITEDGELRCYSNSNNYSIVPSNFTVIVEW